MKIQLFEKNSSVKNSTVYLGYLILKRISKSKGEKKLSIFQITKMIKEISPSCDAKQVIYALILLYAMGLVEFQKPYIKALGSDNSYKENVVFN